MSVRATTAVWDFSAARANARLVLLALADYADDDGVCWPGVESVAGKCLIDERSVIRHLQSLEDAGEIEIQRRPGTSSLYRLTLVDQLPKRREHRQNVTPSKKDRQNVTPDKARLDLSPEPLGTDNSSSLRSEEDAASTSKRELSKSETFADDALARIEPLLRAGKAFSLSGEIGKLYTECWQHAFDDPELNAVQVGQRLCAAYVSAVTDQEPDFARIGRLVREHGKLAIQGLALAAQKPTDYHADAPSLSRSESRRARKCNEHTDCYVVRGDLYSYANAACRGLMREHEIERRTRESERIR